MLFLAYVVRHEKLYLCVHPFADLLTFFAVGILTYISEKLPMFGNVFEMVVTIPVAVITLALHPHVCFAAVAMAAVSIDIYYKVYRVDTQPCICRLLLHCLVTH